MNNLGRNFWVSNFLIILIIIALVFVIKALFNPILSKQQQQYGLDKRLAVLNDITSEADLKHKIEINNFSYIKVTNDRLSAPLTYIEQKEAQLFRKILPISPSTQHSISTNQVIEYSVKNLEYSTLYQHIILLIVAALVITTLFCNLLYLTLFRKNEQLLIEETLDDSDVKSIFTIAAKAIKQKIRNLKSDVSDKEMRINKLSNQANRDSLTELNNRHAFRSELTELLSSDNNQDHAILSVIRIFELSTVNASRGFQQGDHYLLNVAKIIKQVALNYANTQVFRISGSDFAVIAHNMTTTDAHKFSDELKFKFDQYQATHNLESVAFNGMTRVSAKQLPEHVLARADIALAKAQIAGPNAWALEEHSEFQLGEQHWRAVINEVIEKRSFTFLQQPVQAIHRNMKGYQEIYTRFLGENDNIIPASTIFSMAQRIDMIVKLEQLIIERTIANYRQKSDFNTHWGINVSYACIQNSAFLIWLERLLLKESDIAGSLVFEVHEKPLDNHLTASKRFFDMLKRAGSRSAICRFGKGICSFRLFKELKPDYIKIDSSLIVDIEHDSTNQQFIRMIIDVAHRMECQVVAEGIERLEQKHILEHMYIDGIQGFLIARPTPL
ncbi:GGDEF domain-containing protein [Psychromonas sp. B3M02]|uniref:EAL domain-containing protein n=1 Tax=unclassified Psychromonas TaxID=2614957 RepID=UPI000DE92E02|nr:GGDEF domain-containing protein [Psychromonas sp. B3M02]RBW45048.1 GGDEF domain-containing protein [Psychromonas sp. B3M02]